MRAGYIGFLLQLVPSIVFAQHRYTEASVVRYTKKLDVAALDSALSSQRLEDWLLSGPPHLEKVNWGMSLGCDLAAAAKDPLDSLPLCAKIGFERNSVIGWGLIVVGTIGTGVSGPPRVQYIFVNPRDADDPFAEDSRFSEMSTKLSDLPVLLGEAAYTMHHNDVIAYGKAIDVSTLDPELPSQRIDDWLRTGPAGSKKLMWGVTFSCEPGGERTPAPADESPLCVTAVFPQGNISRWATIEIGTFDKGPSGPPRLKFIAVQPMGKDERTRLTSDKLSDLPRLLAGR